MSHLVYFIIMLQSQHPGTNGFTSHGYSANLIWIEVWILGVFLQLMENLKKKKIILL